MNKEIAAIIRESFFIIWGMLLEIIFRILEEYAKLFLLFAEELFNVINEIGNYET